MAKFMFIYMDPVQKKGPELSPDQMQTVMQKWWDWLGKGQDEGWIEAFGNALQPEIKIVRQDHSILDGPLAEAKEFVGGFSLVQADNFDDACEHAKGCPIFEVGGSVEVRAIADIAPPA